MDNPTRSFLQNMDPQEAYERGCTDTELMYKKLLLPLRISFENHFCKHLSTDEINMDGLLLTKVAEIIDTLFFSIIKHGQIECVFEGSEPGSTEELLYRKFHYENIALSSIRMEVERYQDLNSQLSMEKIQLEEKLIKNERELEEAQNTNELLSKLNARFQNRLDEVNNSGQ